MKLGLFFTLLCVLPGLAFGAERDDSAVRVGVNRVSIAGARMPTAVNTITETSADDNSATTTSNTNTTVQVVAASAPAAPSNNAQSATDSTGSSSAEKTSCREAYRACMDEFCLLDESEGNRCACSSNINQSKSLIQEIQKLQEEADLLYTEGVEREQLGAQAKLVFGESEAAKKSSKASGISFAEWIGSTSDEESLGMDEDIGDNLYYMAAEFCASELEACGSTAEME